MAVPLAVHPEQYDAVCARMRPALACSAASKRQLQANLAESSNSSVTNQENGTPPEPKRKNKSFGDEFQLYLVEGSRNEIEFQYQYCSNIEEYLRIYSEAMAYRDVAFWKEAIQDEIDSIMQNNTWILADLPTGCKPLASKWIFKRKMKVDGSINKFKARLVI